MATKEELLKEAKEFIKNEKYERALQNLLDAIKQGVDTADAYYDLGRANHGLNSYDAALRAYNIAIEKDADYAYPYLGIGIVYYYLKQYEEAIKWFNKAMDVKSDFRHSYNWLGNTSAELKKYDLAKEYYQKASELNPNDPWPFYNWGTVCDELKQYDDAIKNYDKANEIDEYFENAYFNRADIYYNSERYSEALYDYKKYLEVTKNRSDRYYNFAQNRIDELGKLLQAPAKVLEAVPETQMELKLPAANPQADTPDNEHLIKIKGIIVGIKKVLQYTGDPIAKTAGSEQGGQMYVTHYTTFEAAKALILKKSPLRLSEGAFLNDTSEGKALFSFLSADNGLLKEPDLTDVERFKSRYFIGSYVPGSLHDDLPLWRTYAKHDNLDAKGCSITYDCGELIKSIKEKLKGDGTDDYTFYRVAYRKGRDATAQFTIPNGNDKPDGSLNKDLNDLLTRLREEVIAYLTVDDRATKDVRTSFIRNHLSDIAYFFKNDLYETEREIRIVLKGDDLVKNIGECPQPQEGAQVEANHRIQIETLPKVYIELVEIVPLLKRLTLGPKMDKKEEWASTFYYYLKNERPNKDSDGKQQPEVEVYISHLPFK